MWVVAARNAPFAALIVFTEWVVNQLMSRPLTQFIEVSSIM
jgi:hypothetical protein